MIEETATVVALGAAFVSALSALYARWQARAAQRANQIALHENRLAVYKGLVRFRGYISARGVGIKEDEVWHFVEIAEISEFYYPSDIHARLDAIAERSLKLLSLNYEWEEAKQYEPEEAKALNEQRQALMREARDECHKVSNDIKPHLRVGGV